MLRLRERLPAPVRRGMAAAGLVTPSFLAAPRWPPSSPAVIAMVAAIARSTSIRDSVSPSLPAEHRDSEPGALITPPCRAVCREGVLLPAWDTPSPRHRGGRAPSLCRSAAQWEGRGEGEGGAPWESVGDTGVGNRTHLILGFLS
ncbi:hypothetical protein E2C01_067065 [Portunus trituberculatus]|uniref:Uncharacterized protein n=1 Tax=Portunus trituberculatus TaxID=210409 RepID=A0A5B7HN54_PORTR|nr:hypothetical protein [Portunus trituberculatus]